MAGGLADLVAMQTSMWSEVPIQGPESSSQRSYAALLSSLDCENICVFIGSPGASTVKGILLSWSG